MAQQIGRQQDQKSLGVLFYIFFYFSIFLFFYFSVENMANPKPLSKFHQIFSPLIIPIYLFLVVLLLIYSYQPKNTAQLDANPLKNARTKLKIIPTHQHGHKNLYLLSNSIQIEINSLGVLMARITIRWDIQQDIPLSASPHQT